MGNVLMINNRKISGFLQTLEPRTRNRPYGSWVYDIFPIVKIRKLVSDIGYNKLKDID